MTDINSYTTEEIIMKSLIQGMLIIAGISIGFIDRILTSKINKDDNH